MDIKTQIIMGYLKFAVYAVKVAMDIWTYMNIAYKQTRSSHKMTFVSIWVRMETHKMRLRHTSCGDISNGFNISLGFQW